jgi:hypothetical protein
MLRRMSVPVAAFAFFTTILAALAGMQGQAPRAVAIDNDDIGGVVTGPKGPEAGHMKSGFEATAWWTRRK